jgi:hypothetical protein
MKRRSMLGLAAAVAASPAAALGQAPGAPPKRYFALMHTPGPKWDSAKGFRDQAGIAGHVGYMSGFFARNQLVMGGPFLDESGGMMILDAPTLRTPRPSPMATPP